MISIVVVVIYLLLFLGILAWIASLSIQGLIPSWLEGITEIINCALAGALGGIIYCIRAVYLNRCVYNRWSSDWSTWYFLRPIVSLLVGGVSYIFLKAGLFAFGHKTQEIEHPFGFLSLAFIAGLNVDKFVKKMEQIAQATWGIEQSRTSTQEDAEDTNQKEKNETNNS